MRRTQEFQTIGRLVMMAVVSGCVTGSVANKANAGEVGESAAKHAAPLRIMCVGDSITAGYTDNPKWDVPFQFGYRSPLYTLLTNAGYRAQFVGESPEPWDGRFGKPRNTPAPDLRAMGQDHHRGYGGWGTEGILANITNWVAADKPDVVLLMIGINDGGSPSARANLEGIVGKIVEARPAAHVIVGQITPAVQRSQAILDYNTHIRETLIPAFQSKGKPVSTANLYTNLLTEGTIDPRLFANDGNHPNAVAYERMARTWFDAIRAIYPLSSSASNAPPAADAWPRKDATPPGVRK